MIGDFAPRLAEVLVDYCRPVQKKGALAVVQGSYAALPLIQELYKALLQRGANPELLVSIPQQFETYMRYATEEQFDFVAPHRMALLDAADMMFGIIAPENTKALAGVDPARMARMQQGGRELTEKYLGRCNDGSLAWNVTAWPTLAAAQQAEMGLLDYEDFVYRACGLHHADPVAHWRALYDRQARLTEWLAGKEHIEVRGPGVELTLNIAGRGWVNCHGDKNFPDGEIYTCPVEDSVNGHIAFSYPTIYGGREVNGVQLTFKDGVVIDASATKGEDYLLSQLDLDEGARRLGEFAIGTNYDITRFTGSTLFDEKIGGTMHMALGASVGLIEGSGGQNKSAIHWDIVHEMKQGGEIYVDGELFYQNGQFVVENIPAAVAGD